LFSVDHKTINCSQLCGLAHFRMRGFYRSMTQREFDDCIRAQLAHLKAGLP
jgi:heme/copper-type cytochrome/quinol oxidase subunit 2